MRMLGQEPLGQLLRALVEGLVRVPLPLAGGEPGDHLVDPLALLSSGELGRYEHDHALTVPVRGDGAPATRTAPHLDDGLAHVGGQATGLRALGEVTHVRNVAGPALVPARANFTIMTGARVISDTLWKRFP